MANSVQLLAGFNSRTREGATSPGRWYGIRNGFNSRTREGATSEPYKEAKEMSFNSRTREGATPVSASSDEPQTVSIHAPVRVRR